MHDHVVVELDHDKVLQLGEVLGEGGVKVIPVLVVDGGDELGLVRIEVVVQGVVPVLRFCIICIIVEMFLSNGSEQCETCAWMRMSWMGSV